MVPRKASLLPKITVACASAVFSSLGSFLDRKGTGSIVQNPIVFFPLFRPKSAQKGEYLCKPDNGYDKKSFFPKWVHLVIQIQMQELSLQHQEGRELDACFLDWFVLLYPDQGFYQTVEWCASSNSTCPKSSLTTLIQFKGAQQK